MPTVQELIEDNQGQDTLILLARYSGVYADGIGEDYWVLNYQNNNFQYVFSFTQTEEGNECFECFEYLVFQFKNGQVENSEIFYEESEEGYTGRYNSMESALNAIFQKYGVVLNKPLEWSERFEESILSDKNKCSSFLFNIHSSKAASKIVNINIDLFGAWCNTPKNKELDIFGRCCIFYIERYGDKKNINYIL